MTPSEEINKVVDKLAEKIGIAVEKVEPIAREVIQQVQNRALLQGCFSLVAMGIFVWLILVVNKKTKKELSEENENGRIVVTGILGVATGVCLICMVNSFSTYVAPLAEIIGV